jgi:hypothetical protein
LSRASLHRLERRWGGRLGIWEPTRVQFGPRTPAAQNEDRSQQTETCQAEGGGDSLGELKSAAAAAALGEGEGSALLLHPAVARFLSLSLSGSFLLAVLLPIACCMYDLVCQWLHVWLDFLLLAALLPDLLVFVACCMAAVARCIAAVPDLLLLPS